MSNRIKGITIEIGGDTTKLNGALKKTDASLKTTQTALRDVGKLLKLDPGNTVLLEQKQRNLAKAIGDTKTRLDQLRQAEEQMRGKDLTEDQQRQYEALQREIVSTEVDLKRLEKQMREFGSVSAQKIAAAGAQIEKFGNKISSAGDKISGLGEKLLPVTAAITGAGIASIKTAATFEDSIASVQATLGIASDATAKLNGETVNVMESLEELARRMGSETKFSASQAADAINILAMAGMSVEQIFDGLPKLLSLAAAGDMEIARAADITTGILAGFNLETEKSGEVVDKLAKLASSAKGNVSSFGDGLSAVAGQAQATGQAFDDVATALGILGNNNISASEGGTMLQRVLKNLYQPTTAAAKELKKLGIEAYNADGSARALPEVLIDLKKALGDMNDEAKNASLSQIFDTASIRGANALIGSAGAEFEDLKEKILDSKDAAQRMADVRMNTLSGQLQVLKSQTEEAAIAFGQALMPVITDLVKMAQKLADWINNLSDEEKQLVVKTAAVVAAAGPALMVGGKLISTVGNLTSGFGKMLKLTPRLVSTIKSLSAATAGFSSVLGVAGIAVGSSIALGVAIEKLDTARIKKLYGLTDAEKKQIEALHDEAEAYRENERIRKAANDGIDAEYYQNKKLWEELQEIVDANGKIKEGYEERAHIISGLLADSLGFEINIVEGQIQKYDELKSSIQDVINQKRAEALVDINKEAYTDAIKNSTAAFENYTNAVAESEAALGDYQTALANYDAMTQEWQEKAASGDEEWLESNQSTYENLKKIRDQELADYQARQQAVKDTLDVYLGYMQTIENYETTIGALSMGEAEAINDALNKLSSGFISAENGTEEMLNNQIARFEAQYTALKQAVQQGMPGVSEEQLNQMQALVDAAKKELERLPEIGESDVDQLKTTVSVDMTAEGEATGSSYAQGVAQGIENNTDPIISAADTLAKRIVAKVHNALDIHSPSGVGENTGEMFDAGIVKGLNKGKKAVEMAAASVSGMIQTPLQSYAPSTPMIRYSEMQQAAQQNVTVTAAPVASDGAINRALGIIIDRLANLNVGIRNAGQFADGVTEYANRRLGRISALQESGVI